MFLILEVIPMDYRILLHSVRPNALETVLMFVNESFTPGFESAPSFSCLSFSHDNGWHLWFSPLMIAIEFCLTLCKVAPMVRMLNQSKRGLS